MPKYCSTASSRWEARSSSVRRMRSPSKSSGPISFCPPPPRVRLTSETRAPRPRLSSACRALFSSSGCATMVSTETPLPILRSASPSPVAPRSSASGRSWAGAAAATTIAASDRARVRGTPRRILRGVVIAALPFAWEKKAPPPRISRRGAKAPGPARESSRDPNQSEYTRYSSRVSRAPRRSGDSRHSRPTPLPDQPPSPRVLPLLAAALRGGAADGALRLRPPLRVLADLRALGKARPCSSSTGSSSRPTSG